MHKKSITGIYFYFHQNGYHQTIDLLEIEAFARTQQDVYIIGNSLKNPAILPGFFKSQIQSLKIEKIILVGYEPGWVKTLIAKEAIDCGLSEEDIHLLSLDELGAFEEKDINLVKAKLFALLNPTAVKKLPKGKFPVKNQDTMVIGGGIAGIQAALEVANSGYKVYLLERTATIGGHMAMFDKTFPTLDCAACILTPKMVEIGQHPNIELLTYSKLKNVSGIPGNFQVSVLKRARRVDLSACIGCGICAEKCPGKAPSEFDAGTTMRKAIYIPFPQAVPNKYVIDEDSCRYVQNGKCGVCVKVCPADAINLDEKDHIEEMSVGQIIVATGFKAFDAAAMENFGYGKYPNVLTSLEFERLINAAGPTGGNITFRIQDKKKNWVFTQGSGEPESVAIIHCVGSRDHNHHPYCSKVCCMYSLKLAHLVKEKLPEARVSEYYIDMRAFGKGYEAFYERIRSEGVNMIRGRTAKITETDEQQLLLRTEDIEHKRILEEKVDMVILSVGLEPADKSPDLAEKLGLEQDQNGWFSAVNNHADPSASGIPGIAIAGVCHGPKDIPDSVAQASAAAAQIIRNLLKNSIPADPRSISLDELEDIIKQK